VATLDELRRDYNKGIDSSKHHINNN